MEMVHGKFTAMLWNTGEKNDQDKFINKSDMK